MARVGFKDSIEAAFTYVKACAKGLASHARILAYVETARDMTRYLDKIGVHYRSMPRYADYYPDMDGALAGGRTMDPIDFNARRLGAADLEQLRPTNPGQLIFGRMQINAFEARTILARERKAKFVLMWIMLRYMLDYPWRRQSKRDRRLTGGQALMGGLMAALKRLQVPIWCQCSLQSLVQKDGRITGIVAQRDGQTVHITAHKGVLLAAGGFERNQAMRDQYLPQPSDQAWAASPPECNTGDAIRAGQQAGAALHLMAHSWGAPTMMVPKEEKYRAMFIERSLPGCLVVNSLGQRFVNESCPYLEFQLAMMKEHARMGGAVPAWIVFDAEFRRKFPIGPFAPGEAVPDSRLRKSWLGVVYWKDETLAGLAQQIGVNADGLTASVAKMNAYAESGIDLEFSRGGNVFDRYYGDDSIKPNPNLAPIGKAPFYAMKLLPGELGTKGGLLTDHDACVLDEQGQRISGLYCIGNNSASVMGPAYPGAGSTLGPAMTFGFRAVAHMLGTPISLVRTDLIESPI
jgi:3-oxosteroid 1-dehydrogenase